MTNFCTKIRLSAKKAYATIDEELNNSV